MRDDILPHVRDPRCGLDTDDRLSPKARQAAEDLASIATQRMSWATWKALVDDAAGRLGYDPEAMIAFARRIHAVVQDAFPKNVRDKDHHPTRRDYLVAAHWLTDDGERVPYPGQHTPRWPSDADAPPAHWSDRA